MDSISQIFLLESTKKKDRVETIQLSQKETPTDERANPAELEDAYINDAIVNNGINKAVSIMTSADFNIEGSDESVNVIQDFLDGIGKNGGNNDWYTLREIILKHQLVYGPAFTEIIYNVKKDHILDLEFVNPKSMDYAKDGSGNIIMDSFSRPIGFVQTLSNNFSNGLPKSDNAPKDVDLNNKIFFANDRIAHFKLNEIGDGFYPIGWIEPIVKVSKWKRIMFEALSNVYYHTAFPIKYWQVGDPSHEPTSDLLKRTSDKLKNADYRSSFAVPYYVKPGILEASNTDKLKEHLKQFIDAEVTSLGPKGLVTGSGEQSNKSILTRQEFLYKLSLRDILERTGKTIENQIFAKIAELENLSDVPKIKWGKLNLEELDAKSDRLSAYAKAGLLTPDPELETIIRKFEGLPVIKNGK
ncbi:MAG TPA: hypothetical protein VMX55_02320 [candidate division Zixibacteria bacterium]|nr:hypothetical protein [candidate division Zixibacteria bacterium]